MDSCLIMRVKEISVPGSGRPVVEHSGTAKRSIYECISSGRRNG